MTPQSSLPDLTPAERFVQLHEGDELFVLANPIDVGTAVLLEHLGYAALGTSSAALARSLGRPDGQGAVSREEAIDHARLMVEATSLPISGDFENGFGETAEEVAQTIRAAIEAGLAGCCIEDATGTEGDPIYSREEAAERFSAAADAVGDAPFVLVGRAENYLHGRPDLADTISRLQALQEAGATALYAPGVVALQDLSSILADIDVPLNVLIGMRGQDYGLDELAEIGVRRVSVGSGFHRIAMAAVAEAASALLTTRSAAPMGAGAPNLDALFRTA